MKFLQNSFISCVIEENRNKIGEHGMLNGEGEEKLDENKKRYLATGFVLMFVPAN